MFKRLKISSKGKQRIMNLVARVIKYETPQEEPQVESTACGDPYPIKLKKFQIIPIQFEEKLGYATKIHDDDIIRNIIAGSLARALVQSPAFDYELVDKPQGQSIAIGNINIIHYE